MKLRSIRHGKPTLTAMHSKSLGQSPLHHIRIKCPTIRRRLNRRLEHIPIRNQRRDAQDLQQHRPVMHAQRTNPVACKTPRVRGKRFAFQRFTIGRGGCAVNGVGDERELKAMHGVGYPLLSFGIERVAVVQGFLTVVLAVAERVSGRATLVSGLKAVGIESTIVQGWVCACGVGRRWT